MSQSHDKSHDTVIHWFEQDLRVRDNPALYAAAQQGTVLPVYILDDVTAAEDAMGAASRWWLHHSLQSLHTALGGTLHVYAGNAPDILSELVRVYRVKAVYWNKRYAPWQCRRDIALQHTLQAQGVAVHRHNGTVLWEPQQVMKKDGTPYKIFTSFYRSGCLSANVPRVPLPPPQPLRLVDTQNDTSIDRLDLVPAVRWDASLMPHWHIGEEGAHVRLRAFLNDGIDNYCSGRDFPAQAAVSRLSPHLHAGELSPNQVWYAVKARREDANTESFCRELGWREFAYHLLYHFPEMPRKNLRCAFDAFPWSEDGAALKRWQQGQTGYPFIDAGMRELWQTGYMHNRVRMLVGSFLVKNLRLHWRHGAQWFQDCLVDADLASNSASWQWVAGCGTDAAPYFRIFNPVTQGKKFDPKGAYTRRYVPELQKLPDTYLFCPWQAPRDVLRKAGVRLGATYPEPMVDLQTSRQCVLQAFASLKTAGHRA